MFLHTLGFKKMFYAMEIKSSLHYNIKINNLFLFFQSVQISMVLLDLVDLLRRQEELRQMEERHKMEMQRRMESM